MNTDRLKKKRNYGTRIIAIVAWTVAIGSYYFQFPFTSVSILIVPFIALYVLMTVIGNKTCLEDLKWWKTYLFFLVYLSIFSVVSIFGNATVKSVFRFFSILAAIPLCGIVEETKFRTEYHIFLFVTVLKCLLLTSIAGYLIATGKFEPLRRWAQSKSLGDIYINPNDHLPRVQVHGNGILPIAFFLNATYRRGKRNAFIDVLILLGIVAAGNFAYYLAIAAFYLYRMIKYIKAEGKPVVRKLFLVTVLVIAGLAFALYSLRQMEYKTEGSNNIRIEQARVLLSDSNCLMGKGLGNRVFYSGLRTYQGDEYFELQTLYILNQIGFIGLGFFYILIFMPFRHFEKSASVLLLIYLVYSFWNPYCFDSTEMLVLLMLVNFKSYRTKKGGLVQLGASA